MALPYYEAATCLEEFYGEALGRAMTLRPEPTNERDVNAICAYDWQGRHVGYVTQDGQPLAFQALRGSGRRSLRGRVCEVSAAHKYVVFECSVETLGAAEDLYPQAPYLDWTYSGPVLKPTQVMVTLDYMMDEISTSLHRGLQLTRKALLFVARFSLHTIISSWGSCPAKVQLFSGTPHLAAINNVRGQLSETISSRFTSLAPLPRCS